MYVYIQSEPGLWTVGFYTPDGKWIPDSDHDSPESATVRVTQLNGGVTKQDTGTWVLVHGWFRAPSPRLHYQRVGEDRTVCGKLPLYAVLDSPKGTIEDRCSTCVNALKSLQDVPRDADLHEINDLIQKGQK